MASDLRVIVSALRMASEIERSGDLVVNIAKTMRRIYGDELTPRIRGLIEQMSEEAAKLYKAAIDAYLDDDAALADLALDHYRLALRAFAAQSADLAEEVSAGSPEVSLLTDRLVGEVHRLEGDDAVPVAVKAMAAGQALSRVDDHARILGARLRYLFTGDPDHLAAEVR
jgi:phosphate transport system protein